MANERETRELRKPGVCGCQCHRVKGYIHIQPCCKKTYEVGSIVVTGASSMIGQQLVPMLAEAGFSVYTPTKANLNCLSVYHVNQYFSVIQPDYCIHLAGYNGGIDFNRQFPADIYAETAHMALNILGVAQQYCRKVVSAMPSCAYYPNERFVKDAWDYNCQYEINEQPSSLLNEKHFEDGSPHPSVECHGLAKRILFDYSRQLHKQLGFNSVCCVINNCYGPGARYNEPDRLKVADSLIKKFVDAQNNNDPSVTLWGDGSPCRELMYCKDAAQGILAVFQQYDDPTEVINIGSGADVSIKDLANTIKNLVGYQGEIVWDATKSNGQMKKLLDNSKMKEIIKGYYPSTSLEDGLRETIEWYRANGGSGESH